MDSLSSGHSRVDTVRIYGVDTIATTIPPAAPATPAPAVVDEWDLPGFRAIATNTRPTIAQIDSILHKISSDVATQHIHHCGVASVVSDPHDVNTRADTTLLVVLDIDETLVDARSDIPHVHVRPGATDMFARLSALRARGVEVWLWTAAMITHAARCIGVLRGMCGELPVTGVIVRGVWANGNFMKDIRCLPLAVHDRVLLVDNTPKMVLAASESSLVVPSYMHVNPYGPSRTVVESSTSHPVLHRVCDIVANLAESRDIRVSAFLASATAIGMCVQPWIMPTQTLRLLYDMPETPLTTPSTTPPATPSTT